MTGKTLPLYIHKTLFALLIFSALLTLPASAEGGAPELAVNVILSDGQEAGCVLDGNVSTYASLSAGSSAVISSTDKICGLYIKWNKVPGRWYLTADGVSYNAGTDGFLHEYISLNSPAGKIIITASGGAVQLTEVCCFGEGSVPDWVQVWQPPCEKADLLLLPTHADDEQLFFAGILPYYAGELGAYVQVAYMTNHWDSLRRPHEQLDGLWTAGVRNYPVIGPFPDDPASLGSKSETVETVLNRAMSVYDEEAVTEYQVELIRRFRPQVIVGHDFDGEYRHGAHILNAYTLRKALELSGDATYYPASAEKYGVWDVPKTYIHLYKENPIVMDWDVPLKHFNWLTAFEVSKAAYACHLSQQRTWFTGWLNQEKAADISTYSPCLYGLYRSTVGQDSGIGDFFENIITYEEQERQENLRLQLEEARRSAELTERMFLETAEKNLRLKHEEKLRLAAEEKARQEEIAAQEKERQRQILILKILTAAVALVILTTLTSLLRRRKRR